MTVKQCVGAASLRRAMWRRGAVAIAAAGLLAGCGSSTTGGTTTEAQADTAAPAAVSDAPDQL
jgi:ABC-type glycerol-3-phosphate transport system substrate-binding protein